jgi:hypothetical protein
MVMSVHMQDRDRLAVRELKHLAKRAAANTGTNVGVFDVIFILHSMPGFCREDHAPVGKRRHTAGEKPNPLGGKGVGSGEVLMDLHKERSE